MCIARLIKLGTYLLMSAHLITYDGHSCFVMLAFNISIAYVCDYLSNLEYF